jgi:hypothetical protein
MKTLRPCLLILSLATAFVLVGCKDKEAAPAAASTLAPTLDSQGEVMALFAKKEYGAAVEALAKLREKANSPSKEAEFTQLTRELLTQLRVVVATDDGAKAAYQTLAQMGAGR